MPCVLTVPRPAVPAAPRLARQVVNQRMAKLKPQGSAAHRRPAAEVILKYDLGGRRAIVCDGHLDEVVIGMAHRGRLNVLANIVGKPYEKIFSEFEGYIDPRSAQGSGDVKYHLGAEGDFVAPDGSKIHISLVANPSHLETVDPVAEGVVRAKQDIFDVGEGGFTMTSGSATLTSKHARDTSLEVATGQCLFYAEDADSEHPFDFDVADQCPTGDDRSERR